jgi:hypothetical protein
MAHEMTVFSVCLAAMRHGHWIVMPFNNIARYVERMLQASPLKQSIAQ